MKKIVIIGGTGMLGKPVVEKLANNNFKVVVLSRKNSQSENSNIEFVKGDLNNKKLIFSILKDAYGVHINLSGISEKMVPIVVSIARQQKVLLITYLSGITVCDLNSYFYPTDIKNINEKAIMVSRLNFVIFKPTWFMESLPLFVNRGRATYFGKQNQKIPFVAAQDYAAMVLRAYKNELRLNTSYTIEGNTSFTFQEGLTHYVAKNHPKIKKVTSLPYFMGTIIASLSRNNALKDTVQFMKYFEETTAEIEDTNGKLIGESTFENWLNKN